MPPSSIPGSLLLFTTTQTPLPVRYPLPESQKSLLIPPLLHASLHLAVDRAPQSLTLTDEGVLMIPNPEDRIDEINGNRSGPDVDAEGDEAADADTEITVKFHIVSDSPALDESRSSDSVRRQKSQISRAIRNLEHYKSGDSRWRGERARKGIDTFLIGWKGVEYRGEKRTSDDEAAGKPDGVLQEAATAVKKIVGSAKLMSKLNADEERAQQAQQERIRREGGLLRDEQKREIAEVWTDLPNLVPQAKKLGTLSLPLPLLKYLGDSPASTKTTSVAPSTRPTFNSRTSDMGARSVARSHELEKEHQQKLEQEEGPRAHVKDPAAVDAPEHEIVVSAQDKSLLAELIPEPGMTNGEATEEEMSFLQGKTKTMLPAVNCMNTPDCHWLPEDLLQYAKENGIELWAGGGGEGCDPLPSAHLHNSMQEFISKLPAGLFKSDTSLQHLVSLDEREKDDEDRGVGVEVEWVLGYTVISKSRNVVQDKGQVGTYVTRSGEIAYLS